MTTTIDIGTLIVTTPDTCGGRPRIKDTRISVSRIAVWSKMGMTPEEIISEIPHLTLAQVYAALAYYYANKEQIESEILAEDLDYQRLQNLLG